MQVVKTPTPKVIILGKTGVGKTTFFNKLTGKKNHAPSGGTSGTKDAEIGRSDPEECPEVALKIVDTPGTTGYGDKLENAIILKLALTTLKYNQILVLVKFDRLGVIMEELKKHLSMVRRYLDWATIVITHFDESYDEVNNMSSIKGAISKEFKITNVIYSKKKSSPRELILQVYDIAAYRDNLEIEISSKYFKTHFDIVEVSFDQDEIVVEYKIKFKEESDRHKELITSLNNEEDEEFLVYSSYLHLVKLADSYCLKFGKENAEALLTNQYIHYLHLKIELNDIIESLTQFYEDILKKKISVITRSPYRRCPHCGLIWVKSQGCDGKTRCGNRPDIIDIVSQDFKTVEFYYENEESKELKWRYVHHEKRNPSKNKYDTKVKKGGVGCGNKIVWSEMPILNVSEMMEISKIESSNYMATHDDMINGDNSFESKIASMSEEIVQSGRINLNDED